MSESLHELEAALADAQREVGYAEDEYTRRSARWNAKPTMKRHMKLWDAYHAREDAMHAFDKWQKAVDKARQFADHPPLKEGLSTRVTDEDLATLRADGQLFDVAAADAVDELDNPAAPIVEVDAPGRHRADDVPEGHESRGTCTVCGTEVAWGSRCHDHPAAGPNAVPEPDTSTPVVTLAPVNGEGRFVPTADVDLPVLEDTREWTAIGTIADGPAKGATAYMGPVDSRYATDACPCHYCTERRNEGLPNAFPDAVAEAEQDERDEAEAELGYTRNEQGAYEYDGPVGEQPEVPAWETAVRSLYGISEDTPIIPHTDFRSTATKIEPDVTVTEHAATPTGEKWRGMTLYVSDAVPSGSMFVFGEGSDASAVTGPETFEGLKAKLDAVRNVARSVGALDGVGDPVTKAEADEAPAQKTVDELMVDAGKAAQERWESRYGSASSFGRFGYTEAFAKAGDVPSAPADHVTGVTDPESVTVDTERDVQQFGSDTVKLKSQTITGSFTMTEAQPEHFQRIFPNARVVIGSNGKVEITANTMARAAEHVAESKPTTPEGKLLAEAAQIIGHDRNDQYGNAEDSFGVIAEFWSTWLTARWRQVMGIPSAEPDEAVYVELTAADVANMLGLMKKARTAVGGYKHDSYVDEAGYVALAERCEAKGSGL